MIEWSKVANDILRYARGVFNEDQQTITDHELKNALNILYHVIYETSGVFVLNGFSHDLEDALNKAIFTEIGEINPLEIYQFFLIRLLNAYMYLRIIQSPVKKVHLSM